MLKAHGLLAARARSRTVFVIAWSSAFVWGAATIACSAPPNDYVPEPMPSVDSRPGLVQNGEGTDEWLPEGEACTRYRRALVQSSEALGCSLDWPRCPELIRPAASLACVVYSAPSVLMCESYFERATTCAQVRPGSCLLTAVIDYHDPACDGPDASQLSPDAGALASDGGHLGEEAGASADESTPLDAGTPDGVDADASYAADSAGAGSDVNDSDAGDSGVDGSDGSGPAGDSATPSSDGTIVETDRGNKGSK